MKKRLILAVFIFMFSYCVKTSAQQRDSLQYLHWDRSKIEYHLGVNTYYHTSYSNVKPGLQFEVLIDRRLGLGVYNNISTGNFAFHQAHAQTNVMSFEQGFSLAIYNNTDKLIHLGAGLKIGFLFLKGDSTKELGLGNIGTAALNDKGISFYPELHATINLSKHFRFQIGTAYNAWMLQNESVVSARSFDTWTFFTSIKIRTNDRWR
jgi:hypothetical protein